LSEALQAAAPSGDLAESSSPAPQQKDGLCGPFWAARILRDLGIGEWDGEEIVEDLIALRAGTVLSDGPPDASLPPGAVSRAVYRYELPTAPEAEAGTAAGPLVEAIEAAGGGAIRCLPLRGEWTPERVVRLVDSASARGGGGRLVANIDTGRLWGGRPPVEALLAELEGRPVAVPAPDWRVGHFCELAGLVRGPGGSLVLIRDSYPSLGWNAHHLQPPRALAAALLRGDGREGGVLFVGSPDRAEEVERLARELGLEVGLWDNGTPR
jgi:uncharacterized protein DUF6885